MDGLQAVIFRIRWKKRQIHKLRISFPCRMHQIQQTVLTGRHRCWILWVEVKLVPLNAIVLRRASWHQGYPGLRVELKKKLAEYHRLLVRKFLFFNKSAERAKYCVERHYDLPFPSFDIKSMKWTVIIISYYFLFLGKFTTEILDMGLQEYLSQILLYQFLDWSLSFRKQKKLLWSILNIGLK